MKNYSLDDYNNYLNTIIQDIKYLTSISQYIKDEDTSINIYNSISTLRGKIVIVRDDIDDIKDGKAPRSLSI